jgi:hypothetical protein
MKQATKPVEITLTHDRYGKPFLEVASPLGNGMACSPNGLRSLAHALRRAADLAEASTDTHTQRVDFVWESFLE